MFNKYIYTKNIEVLLNKYYNYKIDGNFQLVVK